jgi:TrmH family RNA methyltransferase
MQEIITSISNPLVKFAKSVRQKKGRSENGLFFVEGILHVGEALEAGWDIDTLLFCSNRLKSDFGKGLITAATLNGVNVVPVSDKVFEAIAEKDNPQGIAALVHQKFGSLKDLSDCKLVVALISPQDPGNVGAILRTVDAAGADGLILIDGGVDPFHPTSVRASMGTIFWKPIVVASFQEFLDWKGADGFRVVGTSAHSKLEYQDARLDERPTVLLFGSEQKGLAPEQVAGCDIMISIPMHGRASSLNLAVSVGILLFSLKRGLK